MPQPEVPRPPPNLKLRAAREALPSPSGAPGMSMTRRELAEAGNDYVWRHKGQHTNLSERDIGRYERGDAHWPDHWRRYGLRGVLGAYNDTDLGFYPNRKTNTSTNPAATGGAGSEPAVGWMLTALVSSDEAGHSDHILRSLRAELITRRWLAANPTAVDLASLWAGNRAAHDAYQRAEYAEAGQLLPGVVAAGEHLVWQSSGQAQQRAHRALALAYTAASKLAAKLGDGELAWLAADRASSSAMAAEDHLVGAIASYQVACALTRLPGRIDIAAEVVAAASDDLNRRAKADGPTELSAFGSLLLLGAIVAAKQGNRHAAARSLDEAELLARRLGHDGNFLFTGFGPTNLMIHQVSTAVELHQPERAIAIGDHLDTSRMPEVLVSRRAQVHLDLGCAYAQTAGGDPPAVLHLLEVERIAPQVLSASRTSRALLAQLIGRERRSATPGLRALARRTGILV